ncbi:MAG: radical SAM protein, partial [Proteobacteria bacterium]|nr:radical SAM protein [Pseudomonadota bacterium]
MTSESNHYLKGLLRLTMACNAQCLFCNVPIEDFKGGILGERDIVRALEHFAEQDTRTITISGGEPTIAKTRLLDLVRRCRARGIANVDLQTNAVLIDDKYAVDLAEAGVTSAFVALVSHLPHIHDQLMGLVDAHRACLAGIDALLQAGVDVRLNPVTVKHTETLVGDYVDFVAERFPAIRFISLSAVQPHGRAAKNLNLLPHYSQLGPAIELARKKAAAKKIEMVNPYCGVPICVGWSDAIGQCVEAIQEVGHDPTGLRNQGNKSHGQPCRKCALRSLCGGAWHAYWVYRGGDGIESPVKIIEPWVPTAAELDFQSV